MRIVMFTDANNPTTTALIRATMRLSDTRDDVTLAGIVTSRPDAFRSSRRRSVGRWIRRVGVAATNPDARSDPARRTRIDLFRLARARKIPILVPPAGDPNDPAFVAQLLEETRPDVALSYYCTRIWRAHLLQAFPQAVNYHDSFLPSYKGVAATSFSIYYEEQATGFTFHHMTEGIDAGPILVQDSIAIDDHSVFADVARRKAAAAVAALPKVLDLIAANDPGQPQTDLGSYYSGHDLYAITRVTRPDLLTATELRRRIRAFGTVQLAIGGTDWPATRVRTGRPGRRLTFQTADGSYATADRIRGVPLRFARRPTPPR